MLRTLTGSFKPPHAASIAVGELIAAGIPCEAIGLLAMEPIDADSFDVPETAEPGERPGCSGAACLARLLEDRILVGEFAFVAAGLYRCAFEQCGATPAEWPDVGPMTYVVERLQPIVDNGEVVLCVEPADADQAEVALSVFGRHGRSLAGQVA